MSSIAIITARGGSKRIPKKNIKDFCGKPIIAYSIKAALDSCAFDEVMVSTDSNEIADIAKSCGASVPFLRSEKTSDDYAATADVILEVIEKYKEMDREFDIVCCIYPTAPFVTSEKLKEAIALLDDDSVESVIPVVRFSYPPQRAFVINDEKIGYKHPEYASSRSQDLEAMYHDCGQFYVCRTESFIKHGSLVTPNTKPVIVPETEVQDIDTPSDWELAEIKYKRLYCE